MGIRTIKATLQTVVKAILLIVILLLITSCGTGGEKAASKPVEKEKKQTQEIPKHLFPGAEKKTSADKETELPEILEELEETNTVQDAQKKSAKDSLVGGESDQKKQEQGAGNQGNPGDQGGAEKEQNITVSFDIESKNAEAYGYAVYHSTVLTLNKGATVYDALASSGVRYTGEGYISGIEGLYEADCGQGSGWTYLVNGVKPNTGCQNYSLSDGDAVQWSYVLSP